MLTCQADTHHLHTEPESSLSKQMDRPKLKKTCMQNCVTSIDQVALIAKQEGVNKVFLHNLFEWPDMYSNNIFLVLMVFVNAIGINLERNWHGVMWGTRMHICHSLD
jgi:hypothetical protein